MGHLHLPRGPIMLIFYALKQIIKFPGNECMVGDYRHNSIFDFVTCYWILYCNEFFWLFEFYDGVINFLTEP